MMDESSMYYDLLVATHFTSHTTNKPCVIYNYQKKILSTILEKKDKRIIILSPTRAGKSFILAITTLLYIIRNPNQSVLIIAPDYGRARIIMNYIVEHITDTPYIQEHVDLDRSLSVEAIRKEVNKSKITFKNRSNISILTANGKGDTLWGFGGDLIIVDESALITDETFRTRIMRMLGDNPDSIIVEIGNPIKKNHFYESWINPRYKKFHISWEECVEEGRLSKEFIDEQRELLSQREFMVLYDAEFPEDEIDALFKYHSIQEAVNKDIEQTDKKKIIMGIDIARTGRDFSVVVIGVQMNDNIKITNIIRWGQTDTMETTGRIISLIQEYKPERINIDMIGVGAGVFDRLIEQGFKNVEGINVGTSPIQKDRFLNIKAEAYDNLRTLFENKQISIPDNPILISQLLKFRVEFGSNGKIQIDDNQEKSPDEADALMLCVYDTKKVAFNPSVLNMDFGGI